jgi:peptidyl-prolyl cis-trans isomerase D
MLISDLEGSMSVDEVASNYGVEVATAEGLNFSTSQVPSLGNEPAFVGAAFAIEEGHTSSPFATSKAVCMIKVDKVISSPESGDFTSVKNSILSNLQGRSTYQVFQALLENTEVIDNRADFY